MESSRLLNFRVRVPQKTRVRVVILKHVLEYEYFFPLKIGEDQKKRC